MKSAQRVIGQLLDRLDIRNDLFEVSRLIASISATPDAKIVSFLNAHAVNLAACDAAFLHALLDSDFLLRDGVGVKIACALTNRQAGRNLNGTDLIPEILARFAGRRVALFGSSQSTVMTAADRLGRHYGVTVVSAVNGFEPNAAYISEVRALRPDLIVVGMGMPRQESLSLALRAVAKSEGIPCVIINGGAIFEFIAEKVRRAPRWVRLAGLEWAFRLAQEPRRLAHRYVLGNPTFLARVFLYALLSQVGAPDAVSVPPSSEPSEKEGVLLRKKDPPPIA